MDDSKDPAKRAAAKIATGSLMTLAEVAARLSCAPDTVHGLPIPSIRIGRLLRFDPKDVEAFLEKSREEVVAFAEFTRQHAASAGDGQQMFGPESKFNNLHLQLSQVKSGLS